MNDDEAIKYLEDRLHSNPKSLFFARLAYLYLKKGRINEAIELCQEGVKNHPDYIVGNFVLSKAYILNEEYEKAEIELKRVLSYDQQYLAAHKLLGDLMVKMGWENTALMHYKDILRIDPMEEEVRKTLKKIPVEEPDFTKEEKFEEEEIKEKPAEITDKAEKPEEESWLPEIEELVDEDKSESFQDLPIEPSDIIDQDIYMKSETPDFWDEEDSKPDIEKEPLPPTLDQELSKEEEAETSSSLSEEKEEEILEDFFNDASIEQDKEVMGKDVVEDKEEGKEERESEEEKEEEKEGEKEEETIILPPESKLEETKDESDLATWEEITKDDVESESVETISEEGQDKDTGEESTSGPTEEKSEEEKEQESPEEKTEPKKIPKIVSPTLGEIYTVQGEYAKAIKVYETLLEKKPEEKQYFKKIEELKKKLKDSEK